jgi:hypothetical protein
LQYHINDLTGFAFLDDMWLYNSASTIIESSSWGKGLSEEQI